MDTLWDEAMQILLSEHVNYEQAVRIVEAFYAAGYRKLPERPKVLSDEEIERLLENGEEPYLNYANELGINIQDAINFVRFGAQAQLDADIHHYEGKDA